jgi:hypothetical protein
MVERRRSCGCVLSPYLGDHSPSRYKCCKTFKELYQASDGLSKQRSGIIDAVDGMQSVIDDLRSTRLNVPMSRSEKGKVDQSLLLVASRCEDLANDLALDMYIASGGEVPGDL